MTRSYIAQRVGRVQCWPPSADCHDNDGHGTHVAYLLLRLTRHAHLRICKIAQSTQIVDADIQRIADAIKHFSTGKGRVDIINMSFGFPKYTSELKPILDAIRDARKNGVIMFAAAGNAGGNASVSWPAALHETGDLIRVNSSDGDGAPSGFNPDAEAGRWICTLGEGVPSCEPAPSFPLAGFAATRRNVNDTEQEIVYRSGTSFATPIAAAIASIVLGVMDNIAASATYGPDPLNLLPRLRTPLGMEKVLCGTCVRKAGFTRAGFSYITPWYFLSVPEWVQIPAVLGTLMDMPE
jgi:hypothetical protein